MTARLFAKTGQLVGATYTIAEEATIGKNPENTIQLYPALISGKHARIYFDRKANCYFIEDLKSRNGTKVDGVTVVGKEKLDRLHVITFARQFDFVFQVVEKAVGSAAPKPAPLARKPEGDGASKPAAPKTPKSEPAGSKTIVDASFDAIPKLAPSPAGGPDKDAKKTIVGDDVVLPPLTGRKSHSGPAPEKPQPSTPFRDTQKTAVGDDFVPAPKIEQKNADVEPKAGPSKKEEILGYCLEVQNLPSGSKVFTLKDGENVVGREAGCDVLIEDGSLSRKHATLTVKGGKVYVKDLGSKNFTLLDRQKVNYETEIHAGAMLSFGVINAILRKR